MKWIKADEGKPAKDGDYCCRFKGGLNYSTGHYKNVSPVAQLCWDFHWGFPMIGDIDWLDESVTDNPDSVHYLRRLVEHVEASYSGTFKQLHQAKEFLEDYDHVTSMYDNPLRDCVKEKNEMAWCLTAKEKEIAELKTRLSEMYDKYEDYSNGRL